MEGESWEGRSGAVDAGLGRRRCAGRGCVLESRSNGCGRIGRRAGRRVEWWVEWWVEHDNIGRAGNDYDDRPEAVTGVLRDC